MQMPTDWTVGQLVTDFYSMLSQATRRELTAFEEHIPTDGLKLELERTWTHYNAAAFLMASFAVVECALGPRPWEAHPSLPQDEFGALHCIRNALVHNGGDITRNRDRRCLARVRAFHQKLGSAILWTGTGLSAVVDPYFTLSETEVVLEAKAFERIFILVEALCEAGGISFNPPA